MRVWLQSFVKSAHIKKIQLFRKNSTWVSNNAEFDGNFEPLEKVAKVHAIQVLNEKMCAVCKSSLAIYSPNSISASNFAFSDTLTDFLKSFLLILLALFANTEIVVPK